jgi:predicted nucleic acid-binding protein
MTTYALDTNIVSYYLRRDQTVLRRVDAARANDDTIVIPSVVYYETRRGLLAVYSPRKIIVFDRFVKNTTIGIIDRGVAETAAFIYATQKRAGALLEDIDILIAAFCLYHGYTLVTHNTKHFANIDNLRLVDWSA